MAKYIVILFLLLGGCGTQPASPDITFSPTNYIVQGTFFNGKRLFMLHGFEGSHLDITTNASFVAMMNTLTANGWQIVLFDMPMDSRDDWTDGGTAYRDAFVAKMNQAIAWANANYGPAQTQVVGGVSFGGYRALMAQELMPDQFSGYFAIMPLIVLGHLSDFQGLVVPYFDPVFDMPALYNKPAFFIWGTGDERVHYEDTVTFVNGLVANGANVQTQIYPGRGHVVPTDLSDIANWLIATF